MTATTTTRTSRAYGLDGIEIVESAHGYRLHSCRSIREAIQAIPEETRDDWYLPNSEKNWAYRNGKIAYSFTDDLGDTISDYMCGECAEAQILSGRRDDLYISAIITSVNEGMTCECGNEITN